MKSKKSGLIVILFLILFSVKLYSIEGLGLFWLRGNFAKIVARVVNGNNEPVKKAIVVIPETGDNVETNEHGIFEIEIPKHFKLHFEIYKEGFAPYITNFFRVKKHIKIPFQYKLMKSIQETITVTATATGKKLLDIPVKTYVIPREKIEEEKPVNLAEALKFTTGVKVETDCQNCNYTQVRLNGLEGKYTQILIDGLPIISSLASVYGLEQIPSEMIQRIEIVKGGTSSLYGANAIGGVINLITKEPIDNRTILRLQNESILGNSFVKVGFISNYISNDKTSKASFFASYFNREPVDVNGDGFTNLGVLKDTSFGVNLFKSFDSIKGKLKISIARINEYRRGGDNLDKPPHESMIAEMARTNRFDTTISWEQMIGKDIFKLALSYSHHERDSYYGAGKDPNAYGHTLNPMLIGVAHYYHKTGSHMFTFGLSFKSENLKDEAESYDRIIDDKYENIGIMVQDDFRINKTIDLLYGLRVDKHSKVNRIITSPRVSLMLNLSKNIRSRTTVSTGFRAPQVFDEDLHITILGGEGFIVKNDSSLKEEKSYSFNHSFDYYYSSNNSAFQMSMGVFYNRLIDTFVLDEGEGTYNSRVFIRKNGKGLKVYGIEFDFGIKKASLFEFDMGWTFQKSFFDEPEPEFNSKIPFKTPENYGYATLSIDALKFVNFMFTFEYNGSMKMPHYRGYIEKDQLETTSPYYILSATIRKNIKLGTNEFEFFGKIYNITNEYQKDIDKGCFRDAGYIYGPSKPRTFILGIRYKM